MDAHLPMIKWCLELYQLRDLGCKDQWILHAHEKAAQFGNIEILEYLYDQPTKPCRFEYSRFRYRDWQSGGRGMASSTRNRQRPKTFAGSDENADLEMVKWVQKTFAPSCSRDVMTRDGFVISC